MAYFNIYDLNDKYKLDLFNDNLEKFLMILGPRNIGKTTNILVPIMNEKVDSNHKVIFFKNNAIQAHTFKQDFNNRFSGSFQIIGDNVYTLIKSIKHNKKLDSEEIVYKKGEHVGYLANINNYANFKSLEAKNVRYIIFDEFNQIEQYDNYFEKFINLVKTFERFNKICFILIGNRDTPNNELMVRFELIPNQDDNLENDYFIEFKDNMYFIDLGFKQFEDLNNEDTLSSRMASFDHNLNKYMNEGAYLTNTTTLVKPFNKCIKQDYKISYIVSFSGMVATIGIWQEDKVAICVNYDNLQKAYELGYMNIALDKMGTLEEGVVFSETTTNKICKLLLNEIQNNNLYFDSFEAQQKIYNIVKGVR